MIITKPFQLAVRLWAVETFGEEIANDKLERTDRFVEEAMELAQSLGYTRDRAHALVDYVFDRDVGDPVQELGGTLVTLAALSHAHDMDMEHWGWVEIVRCEANKEKIKAKQAAKPRGSALPQ